MNWIVITGAAGFIGSCLVDYLLDKTEDDIIGIDNFDPFYPRKVKEDNLRQARPNKRFHFFEGDLCDIQSLKSISSMHPKINAVYHLAAKAGVRPSILNPLSYEEVNIKGTLNLLEWCATEKIPYIVFASSSSVYGNNTKVPFSESDFVDHPISPYAATKKACELLAHTYHHLYQLNIACIRFFTVYGRRQRPDLAIHKFVTRMDNDKPIPVYGDGSSQRDYTYIDDILDGLYKSLIFLTNQTSKPIFEVFNLGESQTTSLIDLIHLIENNLGKKAIIQWEPNQPGDVPITFADISKSKTILNYQPQTTIEKGIALFVEWYNRVKHQRYSISS